MGRPPNSARKKDPNFEVIDPNPKAILSAFSKFLQDQETFYVQQAKRFSEVSESLLALERKRKRKYEMQPRVQKKPDNAYLLFVKEQQKRVEDQYPTLGSRSISKKLLEIWNQLSEEEKLYYAQRAEELKARKYTDKDFKKRDSDGGMQNFQSWSQAPPPLPQALPQLQPEQQQQQPNYQYGHEAPSDMYDPNHQIQSQMYPHGSVMPPHNYEHQRQYSSEEMKNQPFYPHDTSSYHPTDSLQSYNEYNQNISK